MAVQRRVVRSADVMGFSMAGFEEAFSSRLLLDSESMGSQRLVMNHFTLNAGHSTPNGQHPCPFDEVYYVLRGHARLTLGNEEATVYDLEPGMVAFIPCETNHALDNPGPDPLVLLTIMPQQPSAGANPLYDARVQTWGRSFRLVEGATDVVGHPVDDRQSQGT